MGAPASSVGVTVALATFMDDIELKFLKVECPSCYLAGQVAGGLESRESSGVSDEGESAMSKVVA